MQVLSLKEALHAVMRENHIWRGQLTAQDALFLAPSSLALTKSTTPSPNTRAEVASLSTQLVELLVAPPVLSLAHRNGVKDWEMKWALRNEKLREMRHRLDKTKL